MCSENSVNLNVSLTRSGLVQSTKQVEDKDHRSFILNLDSSKASGSHCTPVIVLKNCELDLSYILTELFNMCVKEFCFPDCWKVSSVVHVFKNVGQRSTAKNYHPVSLLSVVSKVFETFVNNRIVDHLEISFL